MTEPAVIQNADAEGVPATALSVVRGEPTPEELAALVAVIASRRGDDLDDESAAPKTSGWTDRARYVRTPVRPSPNGWRASALPR